MLWGGGSGPLSQMMLTECNVKTHQWSLDLATLNCYEQFSSSDGCESLSGIV